MKTVIMQLIGEAGTALDAQNIAREYLQSRILFFMQEAGAMVQLAFCGGTALRLLYSLPRYSEDLDFSYERRDRSFDFSEMADKIRTGLQREGYTVELKPGREESVVRNTFVRFPGLPYELGLSPYENQVLSIRVEVDMNPPQGAVLDIRIVRKYSVLRLQSHDRASLLAGKLHAVLSREYTKGRDLYDLMWYLSAPAWPLPNREMLGNALRQSGWSEERIAGLDPAEEMIRRFTDIDWDSARSDVTPFLERPAEADYLNRDDMTKLVRDYYLTNGESIL
jgi:predicted nucleotidyltransferase component of viral defense system